ncbi:MAG: hypothetical protein R2857_14120 [Vampirovibrionales bacterium]
MEPTRFNLAINNRLTTTTCPHPNSLSNKEASPLLSRLTSFLNPSI